MGREIRKVPSGWQHPREIRNGREDFKPLYDRDFVSASKRWAEGFLAWENGGREAAGETCEFWEWDVNPPERDAYRPAWTDEERTHLQIYETVSEGTPVSPVFATAEELVEYLVRFGDFWDQSRGNGGWKRENAEAFARTGHAFSMIVKAGKTFLPRDGAPE